MTVPSRASLRSFIFVGGFVLPNIGSAATVPPWRDTDLPDLTFFGLTDGLAALPLTAPGELPALLGHDLGAMHVVHLALLVSYALIVAAAMPTLKRRSRTGGVYPARTAAAMSQMR